MKTKNCMSGVEIQLLLFFYEVGIGKSSLGRFFQKDHTTIIHHIKKYNVVQIKPIRNYIEPEKTPCKVKKQDTSPSPVYLKSVPKCYADYIAIEKSRVERERRERNMSHGVVEGCRIIDHSSRAFSDDWALV